MTFDTGIVTFHRPSNHGTFLQAFALQETLRALGRRPCFIETDHDPPLARRIKKEALKFRHEALLRFKHAANTRRVVNDHLQTGAASRRRYDVVSMTLLYAVQAKGLVSCCLDWCRPAAVDDRSYRSFGIPPFNRVVMFVATGLPPSEGKVARPVHRPLDEVFCAS